MSGTSGEADPASARGAAGDGGAARGRRYRGMTADERAAERRARLVAVALDVFGTEGYAGSAIGDLCRRARVTTRHFYELFEGREELLLAVYDEIIEEAQAAVMDALRAQPDDPDAQIGAGVRAFVHTLLADERKARVNFVEVVGVSPRVEAHRRAVLRQFRDIVLTAAEQLIARDRLPARDLSLVAMGLVGATQEVLVDWVYSERRPPVHHVVDELVRLFAAAVGAPSAAAAALGSHAQD